jgi:hypothetical protein
MPTLNLVTAAGQNAFQTAGKTVSFPLGYYDNPKTKTGGKVGAVEIKTAWRILNSQKGDRPERYITISAEVEIANEYTDSGKVLKFPATLGLVGFHIIQRTKSPEPRDWMWSTFEHVDNAPLATNAIDLEKIPNPLPPAGIAPIQVDRNYSFFNPAYTGPTNVPPTLKPGAKNFTWASQEPYAAKYANTGLRGFYGTQVVRCFKIFPETAEVTAQFHRLLAGTPWANYVLIGTQWMSGGDNRNPSAAPLYLANTTLETYIQLNSLGSCLTCHGFAKTVAKQDANFSFLLQLAK